MVMVSQGDHTPSPDNDHGWFRDFNENLEQSRFLLSLKFYILTLNWRFNLIKTERVCNWGGILYHPLYILKVPALPETNGRFTVDSGWRSSLSLHPDSGASWWIALKQSVVGVFKSADVKMGYRAYLTILQILRWSNWLISVSSLTL